MNTKVRNLDERVDITSEFTLIEKAAEKKLPYGEVEVIVSNSGTDRHGEKILMDGIDIKKVMKNPVLLWAHQYSGLPIGKIVKLWKSGENLMARIRLDHDIYEFANTVYQMMLRGTINAVSIGGIVKAFGETKDGKTDYSVIAALEMIELSVVPVGAHPDALVTAKSIDISAKEFENQYNDFVQRSLVDKVKDLPENEIDLHIKSLKALVTALESSSKDSTVSEGTKRTRKLVVLRQAAKQVDKGAELVIAAINKELKI